MESHICSDGWSSPEWSEKSGRTMANTKIIAVVLSLIIAFAVLGAVAWYEFAAPKDGIPGTISIIDDAGRNVTITSYPQKIVSLAPSTTELLFGVGLSDQTVGVVSYTGYSTEIQNTIKDKNITVVGTFNKVNVELAISLQPDLIVASGSYQQSLAAKFTEQGKTMIMLNPTKFSGILADITLLGKVTGKDANAATLLNSMQSKAQEIVTKTRGLNKPSVYVEYYVNKNGYSSYGASSYVNELIEMAGGVNVFANVTGQYITTSPEEVLKANPSIIIISKGVMSSLSGITPDSIRARPSWNNTSAVQNNKIYEVDEALLTIWGPRIVSGLEALAQIIHPEVFNSTTALASNGTP